jgi:hypothetical protein
MPAQSLRITRSTSIEAVVAWLQGLLAARRFGVLVFGKGKQLVVMDPEQVAQLQAIVSDPTYLAALEGGITDALTHRLTEVDARKTLKEAIGGAMTFDAKTAGAMRRGVADALAGRVKPLKANRRLSDSI